MFVDVFSVYLCDCGIKNRDEPLSNNDIDTKIDNGNWMANAASEDSYALAARNLL